MTARPRRTEEDAAARDWIRGMRLERWATPLAFGIAVLIVVVGAVVVGFGAGPGSVD